MGPANIPPWRNRAAIWESGSGWHGETATGRSFDNHRRGVAQQARVQYGVKRVMHHVPCELPVVYFQFNSDADVSSFTMNVRLVAANIRKPKTSSLHVEVTRAAPVASPVPGELDDDDS